MPEFFTDFATTYPALQQRCGPGTRINLNSLQNMKELDLLSQIGERIGLVFTTAYDDAPEDKELMAANLQVVAEQVLKQTMGTGTRRLMVKTWVQVLQEGRETGPRPLTHEQVEQLMEGAKQQLEASDAEVLVAGGE